MSAADEFGVTPPRRTAHDAARMKEEIYRLALVSSLRGAHVFDGLPDDEIGRIADYAKVRKLAKNNYLFREQDPAKGFFVVRRGLINVHRRSPDGREQVIHVFHPGDSLAEVALLGPIGYPADARAETESEVILIPRDEFVRHQQERPQLAWQMLASMSQHLRTLVSTLESFKLRDAETRFMHWLLQRCPAAEHEARIELDMSKALLASELGTRQETLSRLFAKLRDAGLIDVRGSVIRVPDRQALADVFERNLRGAD